MKLILDNMTRKEDDYGGVFVWYVWWITVGWIQRSLSNGLRGPGAMRRHHQPVPDCNCNIVGSTKEKLESPVILEKREACHRHRAHVCMKKSEPIISPYREGNISSSSLVHCGKRMDEIHLLVMVFFLNNDNNSSKNSQKAAVCDFVTAHTAAYPTHS